MEFNNQNRADEIVRGLLEDSRFGFNDKGGYLRNGVCPDCGKKELLPHLFENYIKRFPPTKENPKATADAYLMEDRGFKLARCRKWYDQEGHRLKDSGEFVPTIRFYLDQKRTRYWERLIGKTKADGQKDRNLLIVNKSMKKYQTAEMCRTGENMIERKYSHKTGWIRIIRVFIENFKK